MRYVLPIFGLFHHLWGLIMFFIFDCNGEIVGNPKGYKTHKGAQAQCNLDRMNETKIMKLLWDRFHAKAQMTDIKTRIYSIRWVDQPKPKSLLDTMFDNPTEYMRNHFQVIHIK
jgi:hypothetical protein